MFRDGMGKRTTELCWFRAPFIETPNNYLERPEEIIIMPSFNRLLGGSPVNVAEGGFLGPIMNSGTVDIDNAQIFLLDGVHLGKRRDLLVKGKDRAKYQKD
jgi:metallophosphoesterase superfamily enzyme